MKTHIKNIASKFVNWYNVKKNLNTFVHADYFNGSHNDAENIFIELKKLVTGDHFHNKEYFHRRLTFLIEEGIDVTSVQTAAFKALAEEEYSQSVKPKKAPKSKKTVKKANKPKRDKNGRFVSRR